MPLLIEIHHDTVRLTGDRGAIVLSVKLDVFITALAQCVERAVFPGRLIDGVRFVRTLGSYTVVCLELSHQVRTVQWLTDDSPAAFGPGAHYQQVRLAFPYILVIVTFWDGALTGQQQLFYRRTPLTRADDTLCFPNLYNVADGYGQVCWVCLQKLHTLVTVPWDEKLQAIVAHLWSAFNRSSEVHEGHSYWGKMRRLDRRLPSVHACQLRPDGSHALRATPTMSRHALTTITQHRGDATMIQLQQAVQQKLVNRNLRLVGLGGIGGILARFLARFLEALSPDSPLYLIDGDTFELRNRARMEFHSLGNKAVVTAQQFAQACPRLNVLPIPAYVSPANISELITTGDICFAMVDNHASRHLLATHCQALPDIVLVSGGNDGVDATHYGTFGNCQLFVRHQGVSLTNASTRFHPEIAQAQDHAPYDLSCGALMQAGAEQLLFTNLAVPSAMLNAFLSWLLHEHPPYEEVYLDVLLGRVLPITRQIAPEADG